MDSRLLALSVPLIAIGFIFPSFPFPITLPQASVVGYTSSNGIDISFNSLTGYSYQYAPNFRAGDGSVIQLQVPRAIEVNVFLPSISDRAYDPTNITIFFETATGQVLATGLMTESGPYGLDDGALFQLSSVITLQANTRYLIAFSTNAVVTQDFFQTQVSTAGTGYLGQTVWPIFSLGLMNVLPSTTGMSNWNYYSSRGDAIFCITCTVPTEVALRFKASQTEAFTSFELGVTGITPAGSASPTSLMTFTLRNDAGNGRPYPLSVQPAIATTTSTVAQIGSNITNGFTFAKVYFSGANLVAGNYYWIVVASPTASPPIILQRLVSAYRNLVLVSANDFAVSGGVPAPGPTDLSYRITTTGESIINTLLPGSENNYFSGVAQSFMPTVTGQIKGAFVGGLNPGNNNVGVSIQTDSGSDSPSGTILTQTTVNFSIYVARPYSSGFFSFPYVSLNAGTKYWLVVQNKGCATLSCSSPNKVFTSQYRGDYYNTPYDFQGTAAHFEILSGSTWTIPSSLGDMNFALVMPTGNENDPIWTQTTMSTSTSTSTTSASTTSTSSSASLTTTTTLSQSTTTTATTTSTTTSSSNGGPGPVILPFGPLTILGLVLLVISARIEPLGREPSK